MSACQLIYGFWDRRTEAPQSAILLTEGSIIITDKRESLLNTKASSPDCFEEILWKIQKWTNLQRCNVKANRWII